jgi:hypothetical protein
MTPVPPHFSHFSDISNLLILFILLVFPEHHEAERAWFFPVIAFVLFRANATVWLKWVVAVDWLEARFSFSFFHVDHDFSPYLSWLEAYKNLSFRNI